MKPSSSRGDARGGDGVRGVAEDEHALAGQIGRVDRARIPGQPRRHAGQHRRRIDAGERARPRAMKSRVAPTPIGTVFVARLAEGALAATAPPAPAISGYSTTLKSASPSRARSAGRGAQRRDDVDVDAEPVEQPRDLGDVVAMAEAERGRARAGCSAAARRSRARPRWCRAAALRAGERAHQLVEGLGGAPVLLALIGRQLERHDRDRQARARAPGRPDRPGSARPCRTRRPASPAGWKRS